MLAWPEGACSRSEQQEVLRGGGWPGWNVVHSSPMEQFEVVGECSYANESDTDPGT